MKDRAGVERGKCNSCECTEYTVQSGSQAIRCDYCDHTPAQHAKVVEGPARGATSQLGACMACGTDTCGKYVPEKAGDTDGDCQYCGCDANVHAAAGTGGGANLLPPPSGDIQPRMSGGQPIQSFALGTCEFPGCPYPKYAEGDFVHNYCSRTCARKHAALGGGHQNMPGHRPAATPPDSPPQPQPEGKVLLQAHRQTLVVQRPGEPPRAAVITTIRATKLPGALEASPKGKVTKPCKKCNMRPANPGYSWCQHCFTSS